MLTEIVIQKVIQSSHLGTTLKVYDNLHLFRASSKRKRSARMGHLKLFVKETFHSMFGETVNEQIIWEK